MKKEPYYAFQELSDEAKKVAAKQIKSMEKTREVWPFISGGTPFNQQMNHDILRWAKDRYSSEIKDVEWCVTIRNEAVIEEIKVEIPKEEALGRCDESVRIAYGRLEELTGKWLSVSHKRSLFLVQKMIKDHGVSQAQMTQWLRFIRKNPEYAPPTFEEDWKNVRYRARMDKKRDLKAWKEIAIIAAVEYAGNQICEKVKKAYIAVYDEMEKEATKKLQEILDYYKSAAYFQEQLEKGTHRGVCFLKDGSVVEGAYDPIT